MKLCVVVALLFVATPHMVNTLGSGWHEAGSRERPDGAGAAGVPKNFELLVTEPRVS